MERPLRRNRHVLFPIIHHQTIRFVREGFHQYRYFYRLLSFQRELLKRFLINSFTTFFWQEANSPFSKSPIYYVLSEAKASHIF